MDSLTKVDVIETNGVGEVRLILLMPGLEHASWIGGPDDAIELAQALTAAADAARKLVQGLVH